MAIEHISGRKPATSKNELLWVFLALFPFARFETNELITRKKVLDCLCFHLSPPSVPQSILHSPTRHLSGVQLHWNAPQIFLSSWFFPSFTAGVKRGRKHGATIVHCIFTGGGVSGIKRNSKDGNFFSSGHGVDGYRTKMHPERFLLFFFFSEAFLVCVCV